MDANWLLAAAMATPLLAFIPAFTPPEWWRSLNDGSAIAASANRILWLELRLGHWG